MIIGAFCSISDDHKEIVLTMRQVVSNSEPSLGMVPWGGVSSILVVTNLVYVLVGVVMEYKALHLSRSSCYMLGSAMPCSRDKLLFLKEGRSSFNTSEKKFSVKQRYLYTKPSFKHM